MYQVLIVDDEPLVRRGIRRCVNWNELGIEMVAEAADGVEALSQFLHDSPDIILLDINMPKMDGLEFARIAKKRDPNCRIVFLTGYNDFEYVRSALRIGVEDYLLKPITSLDVTAVVRAQVEALDAREEAGAAGSASARPSAEESLLRLLKQSGKREQIASRLASDNGFSPDAPVHFVFVQDYLSSCDLWNDGQADELAWFAITNVSSEILEKAHAGWAFVTGKDEIALVVVGPDHEVAPLLDEIRVNIMDLLEIPVDFGVSSRGKLENLHELAKQAREALQCAFVLSNSPCITYEEVMRKKPALPEEYPVEEEKALLDSLFSASLEETLGHIDDFFNSLSEATWDKRQSKRYLLRLLLTLHNTVCSISSWTSDSGGNDPDTDFDPFAIVDEFTSLRQAHDWLREHYTRTYHYVRGVRSRSAQLCARIRNYIEKNYMDSDLNLKKCSEELYLSASYIGLILKKETGHTFVDLLNEYRIKQAEQLLRSGAGKIYDISAKVGFTHPTYFSSVFKKVTGMTPKQYKDAGEPPSRNASEPRARTVKHT